VQHQGRRWNVPDTGRASAAPIRSTTDGCLLPNERSRLPRRPPSRVQGTARVRLSRLAKSSYREARPAGKIAPRTGRYGSSERQHSRVAVTDVSFAYRVAGWARAGGFAADVTPRLPSRLEQRHGGFAALAPLRGKACNAASGPSCFPEE
jgi:hypothetical protein